MDSLYNTYLKMLTTPFDDPSSDLPDISPEDYPALFALADRHCTLPFVLPYFRNTGLYPQILQKSKHMMLNYYQIDQFTRRTVSLLEKLTSFVPVYYANGNHEERMNRERDVYGDLYDQFQMELKRLGVHYLSDRSEEINPWIRVTGCNLREIYYKHHFTVPELPMEELSERVGTAAEKTCFQQMKESFFPDLAEKEREAGHEMYEILLFHSPLFFETCRKWGADLTLCGHFHGGTIRIPGLGGVMTPQYQFFLPWCAGRFDADGKTMIVSRGLGTHSINVRLNDRPELVCVTLRGKQ